MKDPRYYCKGCNLNEASKRDTNLYKEELIDHFKNPRNKKNIDNSDFSSNIHNLSCGDSISISGNIEKDEFGILKIKDLGFDGSGCVISIAATSILTENCIGKRVEEVLAMKKDYILKLLGIQLGPIRLKCALLCLNVLQNGLEKFKVEEKI
ncbi:iron-sulfur cluster assembly scaffold protein [Candidatus Babeliales bacterium]|nr:iron-sulfur cluster assembly scaffold protein [Candidatus Babeliales bacterium]